MRTNTRKHSVVSSNLATVGYSRKYQILDITFRSGASYRYFNVPRKVYEALMRAQSKGEYYNQNIRGIADYGSTKLSSAVDNPTPLFKKTNARFLQGNRHLVINSFGDIVRVCSSEGWAKVDALKWADENPGYTFFAVTVVGEALASTKAQFIKH